MSTTTEQVATMDAGRDLDVAVAAEVMGATEIHPITVIDRHGPHTEPGTSGPRYRMPDGRMGVRATRIPYYSTDTAAAWQVVERMKERWASEPNALRGEPDVWRFHDFADEGWRASVVWLHHDGPIVEVDEMAPTLPLAICRAALAAVRKPF